MKKIKWLILLALIFLMTSPALAQLKITQPGFGMTIQQAIYPGLTGWNVYVGVAPGGPYNLVVSFPYDPNTGIEISPNPNYPELINKEFREFKVDSSYFVIPNGLKRIYVVVKSAWLVSTGSGESPASVEVYIDVDLRPKPSPVIQVFDTGGVK